jgi:hypothetical protein
MLAARATVVAAIAAFAALFAEHAAALDFQRFAALRNQGAAAAARAADPVGLAALQAFDGPDLVGGDGPMARAGLDLALLYSEHADYVARGRPGAFATTVLGVRVGAERVLVDAVVNGNGAALLGFLEALGLVNGAAQGRIVSGWLPIAALDAASRAPGLSFLQPVHAVTNVGAATSQGDTALAAAVARQAYGVDGAGVTVGVLSDSFDCLSGYTTDVASGDLPSGVNVLEEVASCQPVGEPPARDEGRAMLQIVHDVAPGATLAFHSAFNGTASFAAGIVDLVSQAGADVVVDDVAILEQPMFQDGPIAQAVDSAVALGATYFSAAGNWARQSYETTSAFTNTMGTVGRRHDFDPGNGVDLLQTIDLSTGAAALVVLQWNQPFKSVSGGSGAASNLSLVLCDSGGTPLLVSGPNNVGQDAVDVLLVQNTTGAPVQRQLAIERVNGASPTRIKYVVFPLVGAVTISEWDTASATVYGHANAAGARAVGAAWYAQTPAYGTQPALLEPYSSRGGTTVRLSAGGTLLAVPSVRRKPEIVAVDGVDTRFFGSGDFDSTGYPNFFGTSAAAPHAAGLAALARALDPAATPGAVYAALLESSLDMGAAGYDDDSGAGLVQADRALALVAANAGEGVGLGFATTPAGTALESTFLADQFASLGVRITDSDAATGTSQTSLPGAGPTGPLSGNFLYEPSVAAGTWIDLELTPPARDVRFDFATPSGEIALTGYGATGAVVWSGNANGLASFAAPGGGTWLAGSAALPPTLFVARLRIAPVPGTGPLAVDNLRFTTAAPTTDVPIPLPALLAAALLVVGGGYRRLSRDQPRSKR